MKSDDGKMVWFLVHRLVLSAFVGLCPPGMEGCHEDNNGLNNWLWNLRWDTPTGNQRDRIKHGTSLRGRSINKGEDHPKAKLTWERVRKIRADYIRGVFGYKKLAARENVTSGAIVAVIRGDNWRE
jgi:hypothetical protein